MNALAATAAPGQTLPVPHVPGETASTAVAAQAKALVEARYTVALHRPRDIDEVRERLLKECKRPSFAAVARYRKPIGQGVEGPSIRFAEAAIRCMTNITVETITVYDDREKRIVRTMVTDLESNVPYSADVTIEKTVERRSVKQGDEVLRTRMNSQGNLVHIIVGTEDDILNKQNALISKAVRTLGLRLVPGDLIDEAMFEVKRTQKNADAQDPDGAKLKLFDAFGEIGIRVPQLKEYLGHDAASLTPKELAELRGLYAAIRDSETTWREVMDARTQPKAPEGAKSTPSGGTAKLRDAVGAKPAAAAQQDEEGADTSPFSFDQVKARLEAATNVDQLNDAADLIREVADADQRKQLTEIYQARLPQV